MTAIHVKDFRKAVARTSERLLQGNYATEALAARFDRGTMDPLKGPALTYTSVASAVLSLFRYRHGSTDYWLDWDTAGVSLARSPNSQDQHGRLYWTGDEEPRMGAIAAITTVAPYPSAAGTYVLGVAGAHNGTPFTVTPVGGASATMESRAYAWSFVTQYGEEGPLSKPVVASGKIDATSWDLSSLESPPANSGTITTAIHSSGTVTVAISGGIRGWRIGERITFAGVAGMTDLNGTHTITGFFGTGSVQVALTTAQVYAGGPDTWTRASAPHNVTGMTRRIYRSVGTNTEYKLVAEQDATTLTYSDTVASTALGGGPTVQDDTDMPPVNGAFLTELANGAHAIVAGNEVCISEQGKPHSYPSGNRYTFSGTARGAVAVGNSIVIPTDGKPVLVTATVPGAASAASMEGTTAPCIAAASVVDSGDGAVYASDDGLWLCTPAGSRNITEKLFNPDQWAALQPSTFIAAYHQGQYLALRTPADGSPPRLFILDLREPEGGYVEVVDTFDAIYSNPLDGRLYVAKGNKVFKWDEDDTNRYLGSWTGPVHQLGRPTNFAVAQVHADFEDIQPLDDSIEEANDALLASSLTMIGPLGMTPLLTVPVMGTELLPQPEQTARKVVFTLLDGDEVKFSTEVSSAEPFRLPSDFQQRTATLRLTSSCRVYSATVAQGMGELAQVAT